MLIGPPWSKGCSRPAPSAAARPAPCRLPREGSGEPSLEAWKLCFRRLRERSEPPREERGTHARRTFPACGLGETAEGLTRCTPFQLPAADRLISQTKKLLLRQNVFSLVDELPTEWPPDSSPSRPSSTRLPRRNFAPRSHPMKRAPSSPTGCGARRLSHARSPVEPFPLMGNPS